MMLQIGLAQLGGGMPALSGSGKARRLESVNEPPEASCQQIAEHTELRE